MTYPTMDEIEKRSAELEEKRIMTGALCRKGFKLGAQWVIERLQKQEVEQYSKPKK